MMQIMIQMRTKRDENVDQKCLICGEIWTSKNAKNDRKSWQNIVTRTDAHLQTYQETQVGTTGWLKDQPMYGLEDRHTSMRHEGRYVERYTTMMRHKDQPSDCWTDGPTRTRNYRHFCCIIAEDVPIFGTEDEYWSKGKAWMRQWGSSW